MKEINKAEADIDIILLLIPLALGVFAAFLVSPYWGYFSICFVGALGVWELVSKMRTGRTLTQRFKAVMKTENKWKAIFLIFSLDLFFIYLNVHLLLSIGIFK